LLPIAVCQLTDRVLAHPHREQASSHIGSGVLLRVIELQQKVRADLAFKGGHMVFGVAHVFMHQAAHRVLIACAKGAQ